MNVSRIAMLAAAFGLSAGAAEAAMLSGVGEAMVRGMDGNAPPIERVADLVASTNGGRCTLSPPDWGLIVSNGIYFYEFCDYPALPNWVWIDVHTTPDSAGNLSRPVTSYAAPCSTWPPGVFMPAKARLLFCND